MLIVSVGTGSAPKTGPTFQDPDHSIPTQIPGLISALMYGAEVEQDINCRAVGRCVFGNVIDRELGDMVRRQGDDQPGLKVKDRFGLPKTQLSQSLGKQFIYARYNSEFTIEGLSDLGVKEYNLEQLLRMDLATPENMNKLSEIGKATGRLVDAEHFGTFLSRERSGIASL